MTDHDRLFKELLTTFFADFLELFAPDLAHAVVPESLEFLDKELLGQRRRPEPRIVDILARLRTRAPLAGAEGSSLVFVHVENQASYKPGLPRRLFRYYVRLVDRHGEAVYPIAVLSYARRRRPEHMSYSVSLPGLDVLRFQFRVIELGQLAWRAYLVRPNPVAAALMARMNVAEVDRPRVKVACLRMLAGLRLGAAKTRLVSGFIDEYLQLDGAGERLFESEIQATEPHEREQVMEIVTSWMRKGIEQGRVEGRVEGSLQIVLRQLGRRLGSVPPPMEARVQALSAGQLQELAEALLDFIEPADLERWLARQP